VQRRPWLLFPALALLAIGLLLCCRGIDSNLGANAGIAAAEQSTSAAAQVPKVATPVTWETYRWDGRYLSSLGPSPITIDGDFSDWDSLPALDDPPDDTGTGLILMRRPNPDGDIRFWKFTRDNNNLYVYVEVAPGGIILAGAPDAVDAYFLMVHLDVDNDPNTGFITFDPTLPEAWRDYSDWYAPSRIGSDYAFEVGYAHGSVHAGAKPFRTFITYWGLGDDRLGLCTYHGMQEIRFGVPVAKYSGNKLEMGCPFSAFGSNVHAGTVMDVALSIETAGQHAGTGWCQDSTEAIDDYPVPMTAQSP